MKHVALVKEQNNSMFLYEEGEEEQSLNPLPVFPKYTRWQQWSLQSLKQPWVSSVSDLNFCTLAYWAGGLSSHLFTIQHL